MTTQDPRYKHKPSEKHTLEEVLKSLQDLIRNDLPGDKSAAGAPEPPAADADANRAEAPGPGRPEPLPVRAAPRREDFAPVNPAAGPVNLDAVMRSLKDLIGNELNVGDQPVPEEDLTPPLPEEDLLTSAAETLAPLDDEPTFEAPDELAPGDELAPAEEDLTPPLPEDDFLDEAPEEPAPPPAEPAFEQAYAPGPGREPTPPAELSSPEPPAVEEPITDEFAPLDEELTFEETLEAAPPPPESPELPGEISPELLAEPVETTPPETPRAAEPIKTTSSSQQELLFDEPVPLIIERQSLDRKAGQKTEMKPELVTVNATLETPDEHATQSLEAAPEAALPTIEVEESFEDSAYFDVESPLATSPSSEEAGKTAVEPASPAAATPENADDDQGKSGSAADHGITPETPPPETGLKLEIADEPATENPSNTATVDFDSIDLTSSAEAPDPSSVPAASIPAASEPPRAADDVDSMPSIDFEPVRLASDKEAPTPAAAAPPTPANEPVTVATPAAPESTSEVTMTKKPAPDEIKTEAAAAPESDKSPDDKAARPAATDKKRAKAASPESKAPVTRKFNLDDIPVLHEVVAPPAGSILAPPPAPPQAPLPAPDRARDIVVRAVAKLNVELRKSGGAGLDTKTILRLQKLIRQELEKDGEK